MILNIPKRLDSVLEHPLELATCSTLEPVWYLPLPSSLIKSDNPVRLQMSSDGNSDMMEIHEVEKYDKQLYLLDTEVARRPLSFYKFIVCFGSRLTFAAKILFP